MKNHRGLHGECRLVANVDRADTCGRSGDEWVPQPGYRLMGTHPALHERLLTIAEVAEYLGVPVGTLYQWRHKRTGPTGDSGWPPCSLPPSGG